MLKIQRADNWREINRLKEFNDVKVKEGGDQNERLKAMDYDLSRQQMRIEDIQKLIDSRSYDLRNKQLLLEDIQKEILRIKDLNGRQNSDGLVLRRDNDKTLADIIELRKEIDYNAARNADVSAQIRDLELRAKDKDEHLYALRKDLDSSKYSLSSLRNGNVELLNEKDALEKHSQVLQG